MIRSNWNILNVFIKRLLKSDRQIYGRGRIYEQEHNKWNGQMIICLVHLGFKHGLVSWFKGTYEGMVLEPPCGSHLCLLSFQLFDLTKMKNKSEMRQRQNIHQSSRILATYSLIVGISRWFGDCSLAWPKGSYHNWEVVQDIVLVR